MAKTNKPKKRSNYNPYVSSPMFSLTKEQHAAIIDAVYSSFKRMCANNFTQAHWLDVLTRLYVGKYMIEKFYDIDEAKEFLYSLVACRLIERRAAAENHNKWTITEPEKYFIEMGLEAVDRIQYDSLRRDFLLAHKYADMEISKEYVASRAGIEKGLV